MIEANKQNYFQYHGSQIYGSERAVIENAELWGDDYLIKKHEMLTTGEYYSSDFSPHATFVSGGKLYMFLSGGSSGSILSFFELNTSPNKCLTGECGVYYEVLKKELCRN